MGRAVLRWLKLCKEAPHTRELDMQAEGNTGRYLGLAMARIWNQDIEVNRGIFGGCGGFTHRPQVIEVQHSCSFVSKTQI